MGPSAGEPRGPGPATRPTLTSCSAEDRPDVLSPNLKTDPIKAQRQIRSQVRQGGLTKDRDALLAFFDFPAEHWDHLRTSNPVESVFAIVRHRTVRTKGSLSATTAKLVVFKLPAAPQDKSPKAPSLINSAACACTASSNASPKASVIASPTSASAPPCFSPALITASCARHQPPHSLASVLLQTRSSARSTRSTALAVAASLRPSVR